MGIRPYGPSAAKLCIRLMLLARAGPPRKLKHVVRSGVTGLDLQSGRGILRHITLCEKGIYWRLLNGERPAIGSDAIRV